MNRWGCAGNESAARRASKLAAELIRGRHRRTASHLRGTRPAPPSALSNQCPPNPPIKPQRWGSADNTIPETMVSSTNKQATFRTFVPADAGSQIRQSVTRTLERKRWPGATRIDRTWNGDLVSGFEYERFCLLVLTLNGAAPCRTVHCVGPALDRKRLPHMCGKTK